MAVNNNKSAIDILKYYKENYNKVCKLLNEDSKNDPENEPYASKYKAKEILTAMRRSLHKYTLEHSVSHIEGNWFEAMLGAVFLNIGVIEMETDEMKSGGNILSVAVNLLAPHSLKPEIVITLLNVYNNLGILWAKFDQLENAKKNLLEAKEVYENFKCTLLMPLPLDHILGNTEDTTTGFMCLEKAHTLTLYYLAQLFGTLKEDLKSAIYCHVTLKRQLQYQDLEPIDWALNCATLSQYFAEQNGFYQSRHHLAAASTILKQYGDTLAEAESNDEVQLAKLETFKHRSADVARCWVKYCILLMASSRRRLLDDNEDLTEAITDMSNVSLNDSENICGGDIKNLIFSDLKVSDYETKVTDKFLLTYQDAREVFLYCQSCLTQAKEYYTLDTLASDYIELIQDSGQSYSYLAFFEEDDERRAKMHKRRIDMLEELVKEINPVYYLDYCRQLWYELGETYNDILEIKMDKINNANGKPDPRLLKKINMLCEKSIENYEQFVNSMKDKNGKMPAKLNIEMIKPIVSAYAFIGRNSMKRITPDKNIQLNHIMKSFSCYQAVVDICKTDENAATMMKAELGVCNGMVSILPLKIKKLQAELAV